MAEKPTKIEENLIRIETSKKLLGQTAHDMGLIYVDPEEPSGAGTAEITEDSRIDEIADVFRDIDIWDSPIPENNVASDGINVVKDTVHVSKGYYTSDQLATVQQGHVPAPTINVDQSTGEVTASLTPTEGYVLAIQRSNTKQLSEIVNPAVIKDGTTMFGVEGTFTEDASITMTPTSVSGVYESDNLTQGSVVYAKGVKVNGTLPYEPTETIVYFDPVKQESSTPITSPCRVKYLTIQLKTGDGSLLDRLEKI